MEVAETTHWLVATAVILLPVGRAQINSLAERTETLSSSVTILPETGFSDFDPLLDRISFAAGSGATGYGSLTFEQVDNDVLIHLPNGGTVGLADTILEELQPAMFNFLESSQENGQAEKPDQGAVIEDFLVGQLWRQPESAMDALPSLPDGLLNQDEISISADPDFPDDSGWQLG
jgi:hypothetical protein